MKEAIFKIWIKRLGVERIKDLLCPFLSEEEKIKKNLTIDLGVENFLKKIGNQNSDIAPILLSNFDFLHQHIHLFEYMGTDLIQLGAKLANLAYPGDKGDEVIFAHSVSTSGEIKILLYVPFTIDFHTFSEGIEKRSHYIIHTPVLVRFFSKRAIISIMTLTKGDWISLLPEGAIDSRADFKESNIIDKAKSYIQDNIENISFSNCDFVSKAKMLIKMNEIDLYSATGISDCESQYRTLFVSAGGSKKRKTLKVSSPLKVKEINLSAIITKLELVIDKQVLNLPPKTRITLFPINGIIRIPRHIKAGDFNEIQNYLFS